MNGVSNSTVTGKPATTTGIADIDKILGGGIHTSSSILIKADKKTKYSQLINQYFCASAIHLNQDLFCAGVDVIQNTANLMSVVSVESGQAVETVAPSRPLGAVRDDMKIAWRYKNLGMASSSISTGTPSIVFDVTKKIDPAILDKIVGDGRLTLFPIVESRKSDDEDMYSSTLEALEKKISSGKYKNSMLRISINLISTPHWSPSSKSSVYKFITRLHAIITSINAVLMVTIPSYITSVAIQHIFNSVFEIESFKGTDRILHPGYTRSTPGTPSFHGLFHVIKNEFRGVLVRGMDRNLLNSLAFRARKKSFQVETFHLPPADEDEVEDGVEKVKISDW